MPTDKSRANHMQQSMFPIVRAHSVAFDRYTLPNAALCHGSTADATFELSSMDNRPDRKVDKPMENKGNTTVIVPKTQRLPLAPPNRQELVGLLYAMNNYSVALHSLDQQNPHLRRERERQNRSMDNQN
ncbi:hypothetical protein QR680_006928 [Steinernema hermaphroditum]|uniref:Uncharacterized protein n=1 Tax=Steinernema hermaphroditum TaxID=289476 RepID=A0AA39LXA5_9BILA|nr:hypothetical protein QR680_006928 [Steinernema hermaphroditum]